MRLSLHWWLGFSRESLRIFPNDSRLTPYASWKERKYDAIGTYAFVARSCRGKQLRLGRF